MLYCYNENLSIMLNNEGTESPDWQREELGIGLEVTQALNQKQGEERFIVNEYFGKNLDGNFIKKSVEDRFPKYKDLIKVHNNIAYTTQDYYGFNEKYEQIENAIKSKIKLLNTNYRIYANNWLYVYSNMGLLNDLDIRLIIARLKDDISKSEYCFDKVFINAIDKIFVIENNETFEEIDISAAMLAKIKEESLKGVSE